MVTKVTSFSVSTPAARWARARMLPMDRSVCTLSIKICTRLGAFSRISGFRHWSMAAFRKSCWMAMRATSPPEEPVLFFRQRTSCMASSPLSF